MSKNDEKKNEDLETKIKEEHSKKRNKLKMIEWRNLEYLKKLGFGKKFPIKQI